jgi:hypothetical protein
MKRIIVLALVAAALPAHAKVFTKVCQGYVIAAIDGEPTKTLDTASEPVLISDNGSRFQLIYNDQVVPMLMTIKPGIQRSIMGNTIFIKREGTYQFSNNTGDTWAYMDNCKEVK